MSTREEAISRIADVIKVAGRLGDDPATQVYDRIVAPLLDAEYVRSVQAERQLRAKLPPASNPYRQESP